jgi:hypothetical protein
MAKIPVCHCILLLAVSADQVRGGARYRYLEARKIPNVQDIKTGFIKEAV